MIFHLESKAFAMNKAMNKAVVIKNFETFEKYPTRMGTPLCQVDFYTLHSLYVKFAKNYLTKLYKKFRSMQV